MYENTRGRHCIVRYASFILTVALLAATTTMAFAEEANAPTEEVQQAYTELTQLSEKAEQSTYDVISIQAQLNETQSSIDDLNKRIGEGEVELERVRKELSSFIAGDYKQGQQSLIDIMLSSSDFEEFITRVIYANKVVEHERNTIAQVDSLVLELSQQRQDLEQSKVALQNMLEEQTTRVEAATVATTDIQQFIEQMPEEIYQQVVAYEQSVREESAEQSQEILRQIEQMAAEAGMTLDSGSTESSDAGSGSQPSYSQTASDATGGDDSASATDASSGSSYSSTSSSDFMTRLYSLIGSGYQWSGYNWTGSTSDSSFTCSGVVDYALGRSSQSSSPETLYGEVGDNLVYDVSSLQEGDLVFYSYGGRDVGHVAVYVGDGKVIDSIPDGGVAVRDVDYMEVVGGGSFSY